MSTKKAEILSDQFRSVFTVDDPAARYNTLSGQSFPAIGPMIVTTEGVEKLLSGLNISKASGPDNIPCRLLKVLSKQFAPVLQCLSLQIVRSGVCKMELELLFLLSIDKECSI